MGIEQVYQWKMMCDSCETEEYIQTSSESPPEIHCFKLKWYMVTVNYYLLNPERKIFLCEACKAKKERGEIL